MSNKFGARWEIWKGKLVKRICYLRGLSAFVGLSWIICLILDDVESHWIKYQQLCECTLYTPWPNTQLLEGKIFDWTIP